MERPEDVYCFDDEPDDGDLGCAWRIRRAPPTGRLPIVLVSSRHFGMRIHYFKGASTPHLRRECPACKAGHFPRWKGYLLAVVANSGDQIIWEYPAKCGIRVKAALAEYGSLRGQMVVVSRVSERVNGLVTCVFKGPSPQAHRLPQEEPIMPLVFRIMGLNHQAPVEFVEFSKENLSQAEQIDAGSFELEDPKKKKKGRKPDPRSVCNSDAERESLEKEKQEHEEDDDDESCQYV